MIAIRIAVTKRLERVRHATETSAMAATTAVSAQITGANAVASIRIKAQVHAERVLPWRLELPIALAALVTISGSSATATAEPSRPEAMAPRAAASSP